MKHMNLSTLIWRSSKDNEVVHQKDGGGHNWRIHQDMIPTISELIFSKLIS